MSSGHLTASFVGHLGVLLACRFTAPEVVQGPDEVPSEWVRYTLQLPVEDSAVAEHVPGGVDETTRHDELGAMGEGSVFTGDRYAAAGPQDNPDPHLARHHAPPWATHCCGFNEPASGDEAAPLTPWGRDDALGVDPISARGQLGGDDVGRSAGAGGLTQRGSAGEGTQGNTLAERGPHGRAYRCRLP
jgi:hypothetical protein